MGQHVNDPSRGTDTQPVARGSRRMRDEEGSLLYSIPKYYVYKLTPTDYRWNETVWFDGREQLYRVLRPWQVSRVHRRKQRRSTAMIGFLRFEDALKHAVCDRG